MKIAFIGSHCVGKTTAVWYVGTMLKQAGYESVEILPELARICPLPINEEAGFNTVLWILFEQIKTESFMQSKQSHGKEMLILSDSSVFDNYAYGTVSFPEKKNFLHTLVTEWEKIAPYDMLLYFPISWKIIDDGIRSTNTSWQKEVDHALNDLICQIVGHKTWLVTGNTHEERCKDALEIVKQFLEEKGWKKTKSKA